MKRFIEFNVHYYMDLKPFKEVRIMDTDNVDEFLEQSKQWTSGTVSLSAIFDIFDARNYVIKSIAEEHKNWRSDSQKCIDRMKQLFKEAYNEDF